MKFAGLGSATFALIEAIGGNLFDGTPEPVWMLVWGVALLSFASVAKSVLARRNTRQTTSRAVHPRSFEVGRVRQRATLMVQSRG